MNEIIVTEEHSRAVSLHRKIKANVQCINESMYEICMGMKEMRDSRLYKELGYSEFGDYCKTEFDITDRQVYGYISIAENLSADLVNSSSRIGVTKLKMLAALPAEDRTELQQTVNVEETSVRELKAQIAELKKEKKELEARNQETEEELKRSKERTRNMVQKNVELNEQIKELEERPVEVAVAKADTQELERLNGIIEQKSQEIDRIRSEYEIRLQNAEAKQEMLPMESTDTRPAFRAYLANAVDAMKRLTDFMEAHCSDENADMYRSKTKEMLERVGRNI